MAALADVIEQAEVRWEAEDTGKTDPQLVCIPCGEVICDVEHKDTLGVLARTFAQHADECQGDPVTRKR